MKDAVAFAAILARVEYRDWKFIVGEDGERCYLQLRFMARCSKTKEMQGWSSRKWTLSPYMTKSEVIGTAFKAVITAEEHETRENFVYAGRAIFGPHIDVDALHSCADRLDVRL